MSENPLAETGDSGIVDDQIQQLRAVRDDALDRMGMTASAITGTFRLRRSWAPDRNEFAADAVGEAAYLATCYALAYNRAYTLAGDAIGSLEAVTQANPQIDTLTGGTYGETKLFEEAADGIEHTRKASTLLTLMAELQGEYADTARDSDVTPDAVRDELERNGRVENGTIVGVGVVRGGL